MLWLNWNPVTRERPDMAFSMESGTYLTLYRGLKGTKWRPEDHDWALNGAQSLQVRSVGSQLADENLARLEALRVRHDPDGRFFGFGST